MINNLVSSSSINISFCSSHSSISWIHVKQLSNGNNERHVRLQDPTNINMHSIKLHYCYSKAYHFVFRLHIKIVINITTSRMRFWNFSLRKKLGENIVKTLVNIGQKSSYCTYEDFLLHDSLHPLHSLLLIEFSRLLVQTKNWFVC